VGKSRAVAGANIEHLERFSTAFCPKCHKNDFMLTPIAPNCMFCGSGPIREWEGHNRYIYEVVIAGKHYFSVLWRGMCSVCMKKQLYAPRIRMMCKHCDVVKDWLPPVYNAHPVRDGNFLRRLDRHRQDINTGVGGS